MTYLLKKSQENQASALRLYGTHNYYAPAVHCAYYSCIQLMIHILITSGGLTEETIDNNVKSGGAHKYYIDQVKKILIQKNPKKVKYFNDNIYDLKDFRTKSDYKNIDINYDYADRATTLSSQLISFLNGTFGIA